jgi:hypothetical protein
MAQKPDPLDQSVSLDARLDEKGISANARSRTVTAIDRLCGGIVGIPAAAVDRVYQRIQDGTKSEQAIREAEQEAAIEKLRNDPNFGDRLVENFVRQQARKQHNREQVGYKALDYIEQDFNQNEEEITDTISEDWMNFFEDYAENASTEDLQDLWAKVLSREVRKPKSFSLSTIRFIGELDAEIAEKFERAIKYMLPDGFIIKPEDLQNEDLLNLTFLEEVGLLQEVNGSLARTLSAQSDGNRYLKINQVLLQAESKKDVKIPLIRVTRVGREISTILPKESDVSIARYVAHRVSDQCSSISINQILREDEAGNIKYVQVDKPV